ncbi:MAG: ahpE [Pseudonocardiales bacterium]|nr:ahpE [Pseudonocardiales bacterium]
MPIAVGDDAPDFTLKDQNNEEFSLGAQRGEKAVLAVFYPFAFTNICTGELAAIRGEKATFSSSTLTTVTISCDSVYSHKIFDEREGFGFPLLSDFWPHGAVAQAYGVFNDSGGFANRGTFLIDRGGVVRFAEMNGPGQGREPQDWREAIAALA